MKKWVNITVLLFMMTTGLSQANKVLSKVEFQQIFMASFTYMTVIKACNLTPMYGLADETVNEIIGYGYRNRLHDSDTERVSQNLTLFTLQGIDAYKKTTKISCADAAKTMRIIADAVRQLK
jgi:hypothetical protein